MITNSLVERRNTGTSFLQAGVAVAVLAGGTFLASAQIVEYPIDANTGSVSTLSPINVNGNISASALTLVGVGPSSFNQTFAGFGTWPVGSYDAGKYIQFSITPSSGYSVSYTTLTYALFSTLIGTTSHIRSWSLHASTDGFSGSDITLDNVSLAAADSTEMVKFTSDISALGTKTSTVTFRFYGKDEGTGGGGLAGFANRVSFTGIGSNVLLGGNVSPVPEVEEMAVAAGAGLLAFAAIRRRRAA